MIVDDESDFSFKYVDDPFTCNDDNDDEVVVMFVGFGVNMRL